MTRSSGAATSTIEGLDAAVGAFEHPTAESAKAVMTATRASQLIIVASAGNSLCWENLWCEYCPRSWGASIALSYELRQSRPSAPVRGDRIHRRTPRSELVKQSRLDVCSRCFT